MNKLNAIEYINSHSLIGIKAGENRNTFLEIWMVVVQDRIFARSWGFAEKSWYNTFLANPKGQLKCEDLVFDIKAEVPKDLKEITAAVSDAYLQKYRHGDNTPYAEGIVKQEHAEKTMEFIIVS